MALSNFFFFLFFIQGAAFSQAASLYDSLSQKEQGKWSRLYHFADGESRVDDSLFFMDPSDRTDLRKEFELFLKEYHNPQKKWGRFKVGLHCAFPARTQFLINAGVIQKKRGSCPAWQKWQREVDPSGFAVVFSSAYPNNPASMFGHTFLRFKSRHQKKELLHYSANYSALVNHNDPGVIYALKGIFGGYRGYFDLSPYYIFINDYVHSENRDLIEYHLNLKQEQVDFLFAHLWELYQAGSFDYYFTWENCSFLLAEYLNVALDKPLETPKRWYYLPVDLIHALYAQKGLISHITERPSKKREFEKYLEELNENERMQVEKTFDETGDPSLLSTKELDGLIFYYNYVKFQKKGKLSQDKQSAFIRALTVRAKRKEKKESLKYGEFENRPHLAHEAQRVSLSSYKREKEVGLRLGYRSGYHELLSLDKGLDEFSQFKFLSPVLSFAQLDDEFHFIVDEFSLVEVASFHPVTFFDSQLSWKIGGRYERFLNRELCATCGRFLTEGKVGLTFGDKQNIFTILFGGVAEYGGRLRDNYRVGPAYEFLFGTSLKNFKFISLFEGRYNLRNVKDLFDHRLMLAFTGEVANQQSLRFVSKVLWVGESFDEQGYDLILEWGKSF